MIKTLKARIEYLIDYKNKLLEYGINDEIKYINCEIHALEKQIPKPFVHELREKDRAWGKCDYCPSCGAMTFDSRFYRYNYCGNCGQRLRED